jgi:hypothetical protein
MSVTAELKAEVIKYVRHFKYRRKIGEPFPTFNEWLVGPLNVAEPPFSLSGEEQDYQEKLEEMSFFELEKLFERVQEAQAGEERRMAEQDATIRDGGTRGDALSSKPVIDMVSAAVGWKEERTALHAEREALQREVRTITADRDALRMKVKELEDKAAKEKPLATRERNTLLKMVLGMAIKGYGHDLTKSRNTTPKEISDDLAELGISVSDDTVRQWLKEAYDEIGLSSEVLETLKR